MNNSEAMSPAIVLTAEKLEKGEYGDLIPEIYALSSVVENVPWHLNQDVFSHLTKSVRCMENMLDGDIISDLSSESSVTVRNYLNKSIDSVPNSKLLMLMTLLHDVGKDTTIKHFPDGTTKCTGHEAESAKRVPEYAQRFGLSQGQGVTLQQLVGDHDLGHQAVAKTLEDDSPDKNMEILSRQVGDNYIAICLFTLADMQGGDLDQSNPQEFEKRKQILKYFLEHSDNGPKQ